MATSIERVGSLRHSIHIRLWLDMPSYYFWWAITTQTVIAYACSVYSKITTRINTPLCCHGDFHWIFSNHFLLEYMQNCSSFFQNVFARYLKTPLLPEQIFINMMQIVHDFFSTKWSIYTNSGYLLYFLHFFFT